MHRENIFLVSGRIADAKGDPRGEVINRVLYCANENSMRFFAAKTMPDFIILSSVNLRTLERTVEQVLRTVNGEDSKWKFYVDEGIDN